MKKYLKIVSPLVMLLCLLAIFFSRTLPVSKLWNEYAVLYVPTDTSDQLVMQALESSNIKDAVTLYGQFFPVKTNLNSLEYSIYKFNVQNPDFSYISKRNAYFFDKSQSYRLYYIPAAEKAKLNSVLSALHSNGVKGGTDVSASYPWLLPLISIFLLILLTVFSKNKVLFFLSALIAIFNLFCNPFYQLAEATCLLLLCLFFVSNVWKRRGALTYLLSHHSIAVMLTLALFCGFSSTLKSGLMLLLTFLCIFSFYYTFYTIENFLQAKSSFVPVYIRPAKKMSLYAKKQNLVMPIILASSLLLFAVIFITSIGNTNSKSSSKLLLPANTKASDELPQFEDYYKMAWNYKTYPYKSLNRENENESFLEYPRYSLDNGTVRQNSLVMVYNQSFKDSVFDSISELPDNTIEKVMQSEGKDFSGGYSVTNSYNADLFGIIMCLICVFVLLFIYISAIIRKGIKR